MQRIFWIVWCVGVLIFLAYGAVLPFGAPFLPTLSKQGGDALDMLALKPGQYFVDLGCGDGRMLIAAADRGIKALGYELNPFLAFYAWLRTRRYGRLVKVRCRNFWYADISEADGVFVFLLDRFMSKLDEKMVRSSRGREIKLVSHAFKIPGRKPVAKRGAMVLYVYKGK